MQHDFLLQHSSITNCIMPFLSGRLNSCHLLGGHVTMIRQLTWTEPKYAYFRKVYCNVVASRKRDGRCRPITSPSLPSRRYDVCLLNACRPLLSFNFFAILMLSVHLLHQRISQGTQHFGTCPPLQNRRLYLMLVDNLVVGSPCDSEFISRVL
jgi:hypothetical protein